MREVVLDAGGNVVPQETGTAEGERRPGRRGGGPRGGRDRGPSSRACSWPARARAGVRARRHRIAGERYFEALTGVEEGDLIVTRAVQRGAQPRRRRLHQGGRGCVAPFDLTGIALRAIWANKLRSTLTILGNIVAVASIIAVVSLIQGVNAEVGNAIVSQFGPDSFVIERTPMVMTEADIEATRNNPRVGARRRRGHPPIQPQRGGGHGPVAA